ncbi:MAG TPA: hypothetical protein VMG30_16890 [Acidobacteriota bacterium]|nr:hypothetical protein [Acidobacteriota bacterium]
MKATQVDVMNGDHVWTDSQMKQPSEIMAGGPTGGGGMGRGGSRGGGGHRSTSGGGGNGKQPDINESASEPEGSADNQTMRLDLSCLIMALLLHFPDLSHTEFSYVGEGDIDGTKADIVKIVTRNGLEISLAVDQKSHRPITAAYKSAKMDIDRIRPRLKNRTGNEQVLEPQAVEVQIYFSEYKPIAEKGFNDIWLPHQITKTRNGLTVEDMRIKKFQLNPNIKAKQFEKQK